MTADTKIGLLLGLVFIFVVAFLINGLPGFCSTGSTSERTYNTAGFNVEEPGLAKREREVGTRIDLNNVHLKRPQRRARNQASGTVSASDESTLRAVAPLPKPIPGKSTPNTEVVLLKATNHKKPQKNPSKQNARTKRPAVSDSRPWQHKVQEGDTLTTIAKQHYGETVGRRLVTIDTLFAANRRILKSRNDLRIGQQLTIPSIPKALRDVTVQVIGAGSSKRNTSGKRPKTNKLYEVRDGDCLSKIAAAHLGNGNRYAEIVRLNQDLLPDENSLRAGMRLRLPTP
jgi:nucleoid-associated protein YgaU